MLLKQFLLMRNRFLIYCCIVIGSMGCIAEQSQHLIVASAANMQFASKELVKIFEETTQIPTDLIISSSGKLTAQIMEGAPYHVFLSANMKYPDALYESGHCIEPPKIYAYGALVLWTAKEGVTPSIEQLKAEHLTHIALANPKTAPYGEAAVEVLNQYGIFDSLESKLVFGESIAQTNQFILSQAVDVGFTAKSVVHSKDLSQKGQWVEVEGGYYNPIQQGVVILKNKDEFKERSARAFYNFLDSSTAKEILKKYGYQIKEE